jgi:hypothetical protein
MGSRDEVPRWLPRRPRPSLFHPVNRLGGGPPPVVSPSLSLRIHVCFPERPIHGARIERRRQPAAMTCVGVHGHSKPHAEKSYKEGSTERRRDDGRHPKLPASASTSLRAFAVLHAYDASALYRHVGCGRSFRKQSAA